jgi:hypothetical protein
MKTHALATWARLKAMPTTLRMVTIGMWIIGTFAAVSSVLPGWEGEAGRPVALRELWSEGVGLIVLSLGVGMIVLGRLIYSGSPWVRHALMIGIIGIGLSGFIRQEYRDVPDGLLLVVAAIVISLGVRYLYFRREVISYFTQQKKIAEHVVGGNGG